MAVSFPFPKGRPRQLVTFGVLAACTTALYIWQLNTLFSFFAFAFRDAGSSLMLVKLIQAGQTPVTDFGYAYGLLSVLFSQVWMTVFGINPAAFVSAEYIISLVSCYWFARLLTAIDGGYGHLLLLICLWPLALPVTGISHTHVLEPVLLLAALTLHAEGKPRWALVACTTCLFVKPSMAYFYGLWLVVELIAETRPLRIAAWKQVLRALAPAAVMAISIATCLGVYYGWPPLAASLTGKTGRTIYSINHYGVLGYGHSFFWNPAATWKYYLGQHAGFWIFSTLSLFGVAAALITSQATNRRSLRQNDRLICCIAYLLLAFYVLFYGPPESWIYYPFLLVIFWMLILDFWRLRWLLAIALPLYLASTFVVFKMRLHDWRTNVSSPLTRGLPADPEVLSEWSTIRSLAQSSRVAVLSYGGATAILFPDMETAPRLFLERGLTSPREINATLVTLQHADYVVVQVGMPYLNYFDWPVIGDELRKFHTVSKSSRFTVLKRTSP